MMRTTAPSGRMTSGERVLLLTIVLVLLFIWFMYS